MKLRILHTSAALLLSLAAAGPGHAAVTYVAPGDAGSFGAGESLPGASLAATGVRVPPQKLESEVGFTAPKCGFFVVPSMPGKMYHLMRSTSTDGGDIIDAVPGTGGTLTLEWDDSASTDERAFFWVEEVDG